MHILYILLVLSFCCATQADNSCIFLHPTNGVINLTSIGLRNGQPRFRDLSTSLSSYYTYSFNPCYSFTESSCQNVAVCQTSSDRLYSFTLATQNVSKWTIESDSTPVLTYTNGVKTVSVAMICSSNVQDEFQVIGENPVNHYSMSIRSRCACWNGCKTPTPTTITTSRPPPATTHTIYYSACSYRDSLYGTIDLSSIGSMTGTPTFQDVSSIYPNNFVWSYNPCYTFSEMSCRNVAGCQIDTARNISYTIGLQNDVSWINMNSTNKPFRSIIYPSTTTNRRLTVQLICNQTVTSHRLEVLGETSLGEYTMQLTSRCACWDGCIQPSPSPDVFNWNFLIITGGICAGVFLLFCMMITCLFCSKPNRRNRATFIDERTPFAKGSINDRE